jgi:hypothetical protein
MSDGLAIAAVTQVLKHRIGEALTSGNVSGILGTDPKVTALPPDRVLPADGAAQDPLINVFLYRVSPNAALRNENLPALDRPGQPAPQPRLALNLHYLITAVAGKELHSEVLLGHILRLFHDQPVLTRDVVRAALAKAAAGAVTVEFDPALADRIHPLEITMAPMSSGDLSGVWSAFRAVYRTTLACDVALILNKG